MNETELLKAFEDWKGSALEDHDIVNNLAFQAFKEGFRTAIKTFL